MSDEAWDRLSVWMRSCSTCGGSLRTIAGEVTCAMPRCPTDGRVLARAGGGLVYVASDPRAPSAIPERHPPGTTKVITQPKPGTRPYNFSAIARRVLAYGRSWSVLS